MKGFRNAVPVVNRFITDEQIPPRTPKPEQLNQAAEQQTMPERPSQEAAVQSAEVTHTQYTHTIHNTHTQPETKTKRLQLVLTPSLFMALKAAAAKAGMSVNQYACSAFENQISEDTKE